MTPQEEIQVKVNVKTGDYSFNIVGTGATLTFGLAFLLITAAIIIKKFKLMPHIKAKLRTKRKRK